MELIKTYFGRVLGSVVGGLSVWLGGVLGPAWAPTQDEQGALTAFSVGLALALYSLVHRYVNGLINPADEAKPAAE